MSRTSQPCRSAPSSPTVSSRNRAREAAASSPATMPSTPRARSPASVSRSVGSKVLPSMVTDRPPVISRWTPTGSSGVTFMPTSNTALCSWSPHRAADSGPIPPGRLRAMTARSDLRSVTLNDGNSIPCVGFGGYKISPADTEPAVTTALQAGYRHIDTAALYGNEREVGRAVAASGLPRDEVYVVTKVWNADQGYDSTLAAFEASMNRLGLDFLDLYLIHWPLPSRGTFLDTFRALAHLRDQGRIRSIGVSNFEPEHLAMLIDGTGIVPAVNQVELHPRFSQAELRDVHARLGIATEAWAPLEIGRAS